MVDVWFCAPHVLPISKTHLPILPAFAGHHGSRVLAMRAHDIVDSREQHDAGENHDRKVHLWIEC